jgi:vitamin B12 transporter
MLFGLSLQFIIKKMQTLKTNFHKKEIWVFRKWGRKKYSLFSVLGKLLKVSVLSVAYLISVPVVAVSSEPDTTGIRFQFDLDEVEVSASRVPVLYSQVARVLSVIDRAEIERAPAGSVQDLLEYVAGIDIRQRGAEGVQADISIRGGSFDQTLILLNGINITDPQTGHHNLNLPVSLAQIDRIEILEGPAARVYGPNAFSGAINIITRQPGENLVSTQVGAGSFGYLNADLTGSFKTGSMGHMLSGSRTSSDGYISNTDFVSRGLFYSGDLGMDAGKLQIQGGISGKGFGANSFYTPVYPNQYEQVQTMFSSVKFSSVSRLNLTPAVYWRQHTDEFMLFRENPASWYRGHNYHRTDVWGANLNSWVLWGAGKSSVGASFRSEHILSNVLGEPLDVPVKINNRDGFYTHSKTRRYFSLFFEHVVQYNNWFLTAGIMGNHISDHSGGMNFFPGVDISYSIAPAVKLVASANSSLRMPTFTDLYYAGPVNVGNPDLEPEKSLSGEGGIKWATRYLSGHLIYYHRKGTNLIDWVKEPGDEKWSPMNHTRITSAGTEFSVNWYPALQLHKSLPERIQISYLFNQQDKAESNLLSYYVLDNLRHKLVASVTKSFLKKVSMDLKMIYQDRNGGFSRYENGSYAVETPYQPFWIADVKTSYKLKDLQTYVSVSNILNKEYYDLGNVMQPGRWIKAGIRYDLNF